MATKLASQLRALASVGAGSSRSNGSTRPSLIFHPSQAADIDIQTIYLLAQTGLDELIRADGRFKVFKQTLFSREGTRIDRELQTQEYNDKLNKSITSFLRLLSNFIMLTPAHHTMEYLIRRYKIQEYNVDEVILCILPYHETSLFVRIVQLLRLKESRWVFLEALQKTGVAPPRGVLVQRCTSDLAILDAVCQWAMNVSSVASKSRTAISFTSVVVMETIAEVPAVSTEMVNRILPFVLHGFENGVAEEYQVGVLMVIGTLANRTALSPTLVEILFESLAKKLCFGSGFESATTMQLPLMVMIQLMQTQKVQSFPSKAVKILVKVKNFVPILADLVKIFKAEQFISLLTKALTEHCMLHEHYEQVLLSVINMVPIQEQVVQMVSSLVEIFFRKAKDGQFVETNNTKPRDVIRNLLQAIGRRFRSELDNALGGLLQTGVSSKPDTDDGSLFRFLSEVFHGSLHEPLAESQMSLYLSINHPQAQVRGASVRLLSKLTTKSQADAEMHAFLREAFLRRLSDDDYKVVQEVLSVDELVKILPPEELFQALSSVISRCRDDMYTGARTLKLDAETVAKSSFDLLSTDFVGHHPSHSNQVAGILFSNLLFMPKTWSMNCTALKFASQLSWPLFEGQQLAKAYKCSETALESITKKEQQRVLQSSINSEIIQNLASILVENTSLLALWLSRASLTESSKILLFLVLLQCFRVYPKENVFTLVEACFPLLRDEWMSLLSGKTKSMRELQKIDYSVLDEVACTPINFYNHLEVKPTSAYSELLLHVLYRLVACIPCMDIHELKGDGEVVTDIQDKLFLFFAGSPLGKIFLPHVELVLNQMTARSMLSFLSKFVLEKDLRIPAAVRAYSLNVLSYQYGNIADKQELNSENFNFFKDITSVDLQMPLPCLLVALASPLKAVRKSSTRCLNELSRVWERHGLAVKDLQKTTLPALEPECFQNILGVLTESQSMLVTDGSYLGVLLAEKFGPTRSKLSGPQKRFSDDSQLAMINFLVAHGSKLPVHSQCVLFTVLQGVPCSSELVYATHELLQKLLHVRKSNHMLSHTDDGVVKKLSNEEVNLINVLLQMYTQEVFLSLAVESRENEDLMVLFLHAFDYEGGSLLDEAVLQPCLAAVKCLTAEMFGTLGTSVQDTVFQSLISMSCSSSETLRSAAQEGLKKIKPNISMISRHLIYLTEKGCNMNYKNKRQKISDGKSLVCTMRDWPKEGLILVTTATVLELILKSVAFGREQLVLPLFQLLKNIFSGDWPCTKGVESIDSMLLEGVPSNAGLVTHIQQLVLILLESIVNTDVVENKGVFKEADFCIDTIVMAVNQSADDSTRNYSLALLTAVGRILPECLLKHLFGILAVIGESTIIQDNSYSHQIVHDMLKAVVPGWLAATNDSTQLLQVFVNALPRVPANRRLDLVTNLLRVTTEEEGLDTLLYLLLREGAAQEQKGTDAILEEHMVACDGSSMQSSGPTAIWEVEFARKVCRHYLPSVRLPALVRLLTKAQVMGDLKDINANDVLASEQQWHIQQLVNLFVAQQLQSSKPYEGFRQDLSEDLQSSYVLILHLVLVQLQAVDKRAPSWLKKGVEEAACSLLDAVISIMTSEAYIKGITSLINHPDTNIRRKAVRMFTLKIKEEDRIIETKKSKRKNATSSYDSSKSYTLEDIQCQAEMVKAIVKLIIVGGNESLSTKQAAIEALNVSALRFADKLPEVFVSSIPGLVVNFQSKSKTLSAAAFRCVGSIFSKLGPQALSVLPDVMSSLLSVKIHGEVERNDTIVDESGLLLAFLVTVEAVVDTLGAFLTPYLQEIIGLVVLHPQVTRGVDASVATKGASLRRLLPEKIPARLLIGPLLSMYRKAVDAGSDALCGLFEILASLTANLDRPALAAYHTKIFDFCLAAFDLRCKQFKGIVSIDRVESSVITAVIALVMKLSETSFKPLFMKVLEWAETEADGYSHNVLRNIVFYKLVNQLTDKLRSLFVPYFQYFLERCVLYLKGSNVASSLNSVRPKNKKKKLSQFQTGARNEVTSSEWHLRQLVLSSLHKCFLYDSIAFLDASKFQVLLDPIVSQLRVEVPPQNNNGSDGVFENGDIPDVGEMDDTLVSCLGQMALTAGSDLLWKPLNHEVLMQTRSEDLRTRLLGLRVVRFLAENLKEEYLVLLPETIPFLAELLEDADLSVISRTQEVVKLLEELSGEDLAQYF